MVYDSVMSVYIELVLFNNIAVDLLLIVAVQITRGRKIRKLRTMLAVFIGAVCATVYAVAPRWATIVIKALLAPVLTLIFDKYGGERKICVLLDYLKSLACFVCYTYLAGGIVYGISFAFGIDINSYAILGVVALAMALTIFCARRIVRKKASAGRQTENVVIKANGKSVEVVGLCDSGNSLVDDVSGLPVVMLSSDVETKLGKIRPDGFVNVQTVGGESVLPIVPLDEVLVGKVSRKAYGALCGKRFSDCEVILQNSMF